MWLKKFENSQYIVHVLFVHKVRLTDALVSQLNFQKGKDAELAWIDAKIVLRENQVDAKPMTVEDEEPMDGKYMHRLSTYCIFYIFTLILISAQIIIKRGNCHTWINSQDKHFHKNQM